MVALSKHLIYSKTRVDNLSAVKNLNLWGLDLDDVSVCVELSNVEVTNIINFYNACI